MSGLGFTMQGWADLERRLQSLATDEATKAGQSANRAGAAYAAKKIRENAPDGPSPEGQVRNRRRKNGTVRQEKHNKIKNHVRVKKGRNADTTKVENLVVVDAYHAPMVEFGSIHNAATHFMEKTFEDEGQNILNVVANALNKSLTRKGV